MTFEEDLTRQAIAHAVRQGPTRIAILGFTTIALNVREELLSAGFGDRVVGVFDPALPEGRTHLVSPWSDVASAAPDLLVVCADAEKEDLLRAYVTCTGNDQPVPEVVVAGTGHLTFRDALYEELDAPALVPSYATGYANTRIHMYQCLKAAAGAGLSGAIVEFGTFKGGTAAWLARTARRLGLDVPVIGFDSWSGFPSRRSMLDLYAHDRCVFTDLDAVRDYLQPLGVELVVGDIYETAPARLESEPILLAFVDTDNYSPAKAALQAVLPNLVDGGAIVFDHYETTADYVYTLGERMAAQEILGASHLLQVHGTGVYVKLTET